MGLGAEQPIQAVGVLVMTLEGAVSMVELAKLPACWDREAPSVLVVSPEQAVPS